MTFVLPMLNKPINSKFFPAEPKPNAFWCNTSSGGQEENRNYNSVHPSYTNVNYNLYNTTNHFSSVKYTTTNVPHLTGQFPLGPLASGRF